MSKNDVVLYDEKVVELGKNKIELAMREMPVLSKLSETKFDFPNLTVGACLHVTPQTAVLMISLEKAGASVSLCASNPLSTQNDVAAALVQIYRISVYAIHGDSNKSYYKHIDQVLKTNPHITLDDGADLLAAVHSKSDLGRVFGGTEETTTGIVRLKSMEECKKLRYPVIAVNDADTKHLFDNRYGTGQSTLDGVLRATNFLFAGSTVVTAGYGWCGRGFAMRAKGMGAKVIVTEVDPTKALEAAMDGFRVAPMKVAACEGDVFVTFTGDRDVITVDHIKSMKDGAIVANSGHFDVEIEVDKLRSYAGSSVKKLNDCVEEYTLPNGNRIRLLAEGRLVNLAAADGHPSQVMDLSFANQFNAVAYLTKTHSSLKNKVYPVPKHLDEAVARIKLKAMRINIDKLTEVQERYLASWQIGT